ncbi:MAG: alpha/beta fold hydrolase [Gammaproteobacteria bacterium]|nr:alpha/beta fold hydrolase [Gammaproteobacteria bacterium]MDH3506296.1 alpha/beta fold hydrolase [Gammaproteobacteria bacterium]
MNRTRELRITALLALLAAAANSAQAADHPAPQEGEWIVDNFKFQSGETLPELRLHYQTIGDPAGVPVLMLHGTTGSGAYFLAESIAGELYGPGQPLDAERYFLILTDALGAGQSSKPSDGLQTRFPSYTYEDLVHAQYRLVTEHLGITHLRLVIGNSAGGMQTWVWGAMYPDFMDALAPMAALPMPMSGRNWMMRRMLIDGIRNDPDWNGGNYTSQPQTWPRALAYFRFATTGGTRAVYKATPTREATDRAIAARLEAGTPLDANDVLYAYEASRNYDPSPDLERIEAALLAIVAEDDERNPAELGVLEREIPRVRNGRYLVIPASEDTRGHGTTRNASLWKHELAELLRTAPDRSR